MKSEVLFSENNTKIILPTFTSQLPDGSQVRCLKDSGCQRTFISEKVVGANNFKIIEIGIILTVEGFNSKQTYEVDLVEVPLMIGDEIKKVQAVCVPEMNIDLYLPNLNSVVGQFLDRNFVLVTENWCLKLTIFQI